MKTFKTYLEARDYSVMNPLDTVESKLYWNSGDLYEHSFFVNGKRHGECKTYYSNGQLDEHRFYVGGNLHGEYKTYHYDGKLHCHRFYVNGLEHGESKSYFIDGKLHKHCFFVAGEDINVDHLRDGSYKSRCILITLFDGNLFDEDI